MYPELHPRLSGHRLAEHSCVGIAKWEQDSPVVNTRAWLHANGGSFKRGWKDANRSEYIWHGKGSVKGDPGRKDPPVFGWQPYIRKAFRNSPGAELLRGASHTPGSTSGLKPGQRTSTSGLKPGQSTGTLRQSVSLPSLATKMVYPPSPAFVRNYMRGPLATEAEGGAEEEEEEDEEAPGLNYYDLGDEPANSAEDSKSAMAKPSRRAPRGKAAAVLARLAKREPEPDEPEEVSHGADEGWHVPVLQRQSYFAVLDSLTAPFPDGDLPLLRLRDATPLESTRRPASKERAGSRGSSWRRSRRRSSREEMSNIDLAAFNDLLEEFEVEDPPLSALTQHFLHTKQNAVARLLHQDREALSRLRRVEFEDDLTTPDPVVLRSDPSKVAAVFKLLQSHGALDTKADLGNALLLLEHPYPNLSWIEQVVTERLQKRQMLDETDFAKLILEYESRRIRFLRDLFDARAVQPGQVRLADVPTMIEQAGVPLMTGAAEALCDRWEEPLVGLDAFVYLFEDALEHAGLTPAEHARAMKSYKSSATGLATEAQLREYLTSSCTIADVLGREAVDVIVAQAVHQSRVKEVVLDLESWEHMPPLALAYEDEGYTFGDPIISGRAFLAAVRAMHHRLSRVLWDRLTLKGFDLSVDLLLQGDLLSILEDIGEVSCTPALVTDIMKYSGVGVHSEGYPYHQAYTFLLEYCLLDGISQSERIYLVDVFQRFDADGSRTLDLVELGPVIRWVGYQPSLYRVYNFVEEMSLNEDSRFTVPQFVGLMGRFVKANLNLAREVFVSRGKDGSEGSACVPAHELARVLARIGYCSTDQEIDRVIEDAGGPNIMIDFRRFKELEELHKARVRKFMERNEGSTEVELQQYCRMFAEHKITDRVNGKEYFDEAAMRVVLEQKFPDIGLCRERHTQLADMVKRSDLDSDGKIDFGEFCQLLVFLNHEDETSLIMKGIAMKKELGYTTEDMANCRSLFNAADVTLSGDITMPELLSILSRMVSVTVTSVREIQAMVNRVDDGDGKLDFWEFLRFIRHLQETNWRNINGIARAVSR